MASARSGVSWRALCVAVGLLWCLPAVALPAGGEPVTPGHAPGGPPDRKVGYFAQWSIYQRNYFVKNLDTSGAARQLTHLGYAAANLDPAGRCSQSNRPGQGDAWADYQRRFTAEQTVEGRADSYEQPLAGNLNQLRQLKRKYPHLKIYLALGGWPWSKNFHAAAASPQSRAAHVKSCIDMWIRGNLPKLGGEPQGGPGVAAGIFDGIDLDWEWPGSQGGPGNVVDPADKRNYTALLREWRKQLDEVGRERHRHFDLTAYLPADPAKLAAGYEVRQIFDLLTFANVQGYDLHGAYEETTNQQSALRSPVGDPAPGRPSIAQGVGTLLEMGAPPNKLVLSIPCYGRGWTGVPDRNNGLFQTSAGPAPSPTGPGYADYQTLKARADSFALHRDDFAGFAWLYDGRTFWTYDDPVEVARKVDFVKREGLGGAMLWTLDGDTPNGDLMRAVNDEFASGRPGKP